jgi:predicted transport protein
MKKPILGFGNDVEVRPTTKYMPYRRNKAFEGFVILKNALKIYLNIKKSALEDSLGKARNVEEVEHYPLGDTEIILSDENDLSYSLKLIAQ